MWFMLVSILAIIFVYFYLYKPTKHWKKLKVPYVTPWPLLGNMGKSTLRINTVQDDISEMYNATQGRVLGIYFFNSPVLMIRDLNLIKKLGIKDFDHFVDRRGFIDAVTDPLIGKILPALRGQKWRDMRATLSPAFTSSKMKAMFELISDCAKQFTEYFEKIVEAYKPYELELKDVFTRFGTDVIASTAFGIQCDSLRDKENKFFLMGKDATDFQSGLRPIKFLIFFLSKSLAKFFKLQFLSQEVISFFRNIIKINIASREKEGIVRPDLIHLLMEARKGKLKHEVQKDEDAGFATVEVSCWQGCQNSQTSDDDITAQALLFFIGGFDPISTTMCHMSYELAQHPDIQERLQEEIDKALRDCKGKVTYDIVMKLKYLDMVLSETLRKWPTIVMLDRVCIDTYTILPELPEEKPIKLKKNDAISFPCHAIHRDPKYFPEPDKFNPERFSDENKDKIDPMSYFPFGVGPRNCIGSRFALLEAKLMFINLLSKFSIVLTEKSQVPFKIRKGSFNPDAEKGFWVGLQKRTNI